MADQQTMVAEPQFETKKQQKNKPKKQPRYSVILWDDSDHSYDYVVLMMKQCFAIRSKPDSRSPRKSITVVVPSA